MDTKVTAHLDTKVTARFYAVVPLNEHQADFEACLNQLLSLGEDKLVCDVGDAVIQGGEFAEHKGRISGDLVRLQAENFPTLVERAGAKPKKLRLAGFLGHHSCFLYDTKLKVLAYQYTRNSVSLSRFRAYIAGLCKSEFGFLPLMKPASLQQLNKMSPKTLHIKIAEPEDLQAVEDDQKKLRASLLNLKNLSSGMYVKVQIGLGHNKGQLNKGSIRGLVDWLLDQRSTKTGGVTSIKVIGKDIDDEHVPLDFIKAQLGDTEELSLGLAAPDENYQMRTAFLQKAFDKNVATIKSVIKAHDHSG